MAVGAPQYKKDLDTITTVMGRAAEHGAGGEAEEAGLVQL